MIAKRQQDATAAEPVRFRVGPLTIPVAADALAAWVDRADAGARLTYAYGPEPLRDHATFRLASQLQAEGKITIFQPRRAGSPLFDFVAERLAGATAPAPNRDALLPEEERVYAMLKNHAACGLACPPDPEIARHCRLSGPDAASYRMRKLRTLGFIHVENRGPLKPRVVTIIATGQSTAGAPL